MGIMADSGLAAFMSLILFCFFFSLRNVFYGNRSVIKFIRKVRSVSHHEFTAICFLYALIGREHTIYTVEISKKKK